MCTQVIAAMDSAPLQDGNAVSCGLLNGLRHRAHACQCLAAAPPRLIVNSSATAQAAATATGLTALKHCLRAHTVMHAGPDMCKCYSINVDGVPQAYWIKFRQPHWISNGTSFMESKVAKAMLPAFFSTASHVGVTMPARGAAKSLEFAVFPMATAADCQPDEAYITKPQQAGPRMQPSGKQQIDTCQAVSVSRYLKAVQPEQSG